MNTIPPFARVDAEDDVIYIHGHGSCVALTFTEARAIRDEITALLSMWDDPERDYYHVPADVQPGGVDPIDDASSQRPDRDPQVDTLLARERVISEVSDRLMPYLSVLGEVA